MDTPVSADKWWTVKLLFESVQKPSETNEDFSGGSTEINDERLFEESIILIKASTKQQVFELAGDVAKDMEHGYVDVFGEMVKWRFRYILDVFQLNDQELLTGTEVYSRFIHAPKDLKTSELIIRYYPEKIDQ